jgi:outer membrane protein OmpA-like peptidoglycan-associated protein
MTPAQLRLLPLLVCLALPLAACKKHASPTSIAGDRANPAAGAATPAVAPASTPAPAESQNAGAPAGAANGEPVDKPFDFNTVPEASGNTPPFPYVDVPPKIVGGFLSTETVPLDRVWLILGDHMHADEGRVSTRTFQAANAEMSPLELRRNYENAMRAMGAVKVNTVQPNNPLLGPTEGDAFVERIRRLALPQIDSAYDVYLARKGEARHWMVVMVSNLETRLISIEEQPFKQTLDYEAEHGKSQPVTASGTPSAAPQPVDIGALPVNNAALPPFPYLSYPPGVPEGLRFTEHANFDAVQIIVGKALRTVEGKVETRSFHDRDAKMSQMALRRNYEAAVKGLGGVKVNAIGPDDPALQGADQKKMRYPSGSMSYDSYLVRTPGQNVWLVLMFSKDDTALLAVEEKAMQQSVTLVTADAMRKELAAKGKVTLYINFDTDKASIRPDGKPAVDEITKLLKADPGLRLAVEGHTDDTGNAAHNQALSTQRAEAVVQTLVRDGIDAGRLRAAGHGATQPLADNQDEAGRARNRRVELIKL